MDIEDPSGTTILIPSVGEYIFPEMSYKGTCAVQTWRNIFVDIWFYGGRRNGLYTCSMITIFTNPSTRAGYNTRSILKRSLTGSNSEFSF